MKKCFRRIKLYKAWLVILLGFLCFGFLFFRFLLPIIIFARANSLTPRFFINMAFAKKLPLKSFEERTNILILGIPGGNHAGSDLTDTMLFLSFNQKRKKSFVVSLPRDIWSETLKDKINSAYHYGEEKKKGGGLILAKATVEEILDQRVHYIFVIDFNAFEKVIDALGGIEINVERGFDDYKFPLLGKEEDLCDGDPEYKCRYEYIRFEKGWQKMDGATTLKFIRSRNAEDEEGTDFARMKRQQKILEAVKNKILSWQTLTKPQVLIDAFDALQEKSQTDANLGEALYLAKLFFNKGGRNTISLEEQFINPPLWQYGGRWILIPKEGWENFHLFISKELGL